MQSLKLSLLYRAQNLLSNPVMGWFIWFGFAVLFYQSGMHLTIWLVEPENFEGGLTWLWIGAFPLLFVAFFHINRRFGCASGACKPQDPNLRFPPGH